MTRIATVLTGFVLACASSCTEPAREAGNAAGNEPGSEALAEVTSDLRVSDWSNPVSVANAFYGAAVATLNGTTFLVRSGDGSCSLDDDTDLFWQKLTPAGWTAPTRIPGQGASRRVSLAAFNGFLYMVHNGSSDGSATWMSRFDPSTETWSTNFQIPYPSFAGPPAIIAFGRRLILIGTTSTFQMWVASMNTGEVFTTAVAMTGHLSASRPSAEVYSGKLYVAHRLGQTGDIGYTVFDGTTWTADQRIPAGPLGATIRGVEPSIAAVNGFLHLVHLRPSDASIWWTYFDTCTWAAEVSIGTQVSSLGPALAQGGPGLVLTATHDLTCAGNDGRNVLVSQFTAPPPPITPPSGCQVIGGF